MKDGIFHTTLVMRDGRLIHSQGDGHLFDDFRKELSEGQKVDAFFEILGDDYTISQIAKVHKCIRTLAADTGISFEDMKLEVKKKAGLCFRKELHGELFLVVRSFTKCSREEIGLAIEAAIEIGDTVGSNVR